MKKLIVLLTLVLGLSFMAFAAEDAAGTWKGTLETPNGAITNTFVLKVEDGKLTGTIANDMMGSSPISDGKIDGDKISFTQPSDFGALVYSGTIKGDTMTLTLVVGGGQFTLNITATRVKA